MRRRRGGAGADRPYPGRHGEGDAAEEPFRASLALRQDIANVYGGLSLVVASRAG
ncbi:hypothetical protein ACFQU7_11430 [Pseudoroseomonas wenyumeiae]